MKKKLTLLGIVWATGWLALLLTAAAVQAQTPQLTPTFESIGIDLPLAGVNSKSVCHVKFREAGGTWRDGLDLYADDEKGGKTGFRGSVVLLKPDTEYELELRYALNGSSFTTKKASMRTWSEKFKVAETIRVRNRKELADKLKSGSASRGYVVFDGGGATMEGSSEKNNNNVIDIKEKQYVILRNMKFTKSDQNGIDISNSHHIVVENCEVYEWGRKGANYCDKKWGKFITGYILAGVSVVTSSQVVVQNTIVRDPACNSCNWEDIPKSVSKSHPNGPRGISVRGVTHSVFRYNKVYSKSTDHYFADVFHGEGYSKNEDGKVFYGTKSDVDVYGNEFANGWDDGIEIEGLNENIRIWNNVVHNVFHGVASDMNDRQYYGPAYLWRNVFTDLSRTPDNSSNGRAFKLENSVGKGGIYLFNNTVSGFGGKHKAPSGTIVNGEQYNVTALNNIFEITKGNLSYGGALKSGLINYNAYSHGQISHPQGKNWNKNSQFDVKYIYQQDGPWNYYVQGKGQGAGTPIPNFVEVSAGKKIDLGASQAGVWKICVGPTADRNCSGGTVPPPPPVVTDSLLAYRATITSASADFPDKGYWANVPAYRFTDPKGQSDNEIEIKAIWDEKYLAVGVYVTDAVLLGPVDAIQPWKNDAIDLLFDPQNTRSDTWSTAQGHRQVIINVSGRQYYDPASFEVEMQNGSGFVDHYFYEVRIPWASLGGIIPSEGVEIGFDVANHDRDSPDKKTQFSYTKRTTDFKIPSQFAKLILNKKPSVPILTPVATSPIKLDGKLDELAWGANALENDEPKYEFTNPANALIKAKTVWTADSLFVAIKVQDNELVATSPDQPWRNDGIELLFDVAHSKASKWSTALGHRQFVVDIKGNTYADPGNTAFAWGKTVKSERPLATYIIEVGIPWTSLGLKEAPRSGLTLGFDIANNDQDDIQGTTRSITFTGRTTSFKTPSAFAELTLAGGTNARLSTPGKSLIAPVEVAGRQLIVYPNPSPEGGSAQLTLSGFGPKALMQIVNTKGQVVYQGLLTDSSVQLSQRFPRGLYVVRVSDAQGTLTEKLLIE